MSDGGASSTSPAPPSSEHVRKVSLNVGGTVFCTYAETLARFPSTLLGTMFACSGESEGMTRRDDGKLRCDEMAFFDRNPVVFAAILEWYRVGLLVRPAAVTVDQMVLELDFFQVPIRHREELQLTADASLGQRLRIKALLAAEAKAEPLLGKLEDLCVGAAEQAAAEGCQVVKCDFLKGHSYLRASAGVDKTCPSKFHTNSVDKAHVAFLRDTTNVTLLLRRLKLRGFDVTLTTIGSSAKSFCVHFQLF
jgi:hypothetical protein